MKKEERDKILNNIITISIVLNDKYITLATAKTDENEEIVEQTLNHIKMAREYEEKLYNSLDLKNVPYERFCYLLRKRNLNQIDYDDIDSRFFNYISSLTITNPFLSQEEDIVDRIQENKAAITRQVKRDFTLTFLFLISQAIKQESDINNKYNLWMEYYFTIFKEKSAECFLDTFPKTPKKSGRNRCILFNQEKKLVNEIYQETLREYIEEDLERIKEDYNDQVLAQNPEETINKHLALLAITASKMLLLEVERKTIAQQKKEEQDVSAALKRGENLDKSYQKIKAYTSK